MEFNDGIKIAKVVDLIREIKNDTELFRKRVLDSINTPSDSIEKPTSVVLSYIDGKYVVALKPYGSYKINEQGQIEASPSKYPAGIDSTIVTQLLSVNYNAINNTLEELNYNPPRYFVSYAQPAGYMSSKIEEDGVTLLITDSRIELSQPASNTKIQYRVLDKKVKASIFGAEIEFKFDEDDENYKGVLSTILDNVIPIDMLPSVIKTKLGLSMEQKQEKTKTV